MDSKNLYLREATAEDVDLLFAWANDPEVRKQSFSTAEIKYEEHVAWYQRLLSRPDAKQYILISGEEEVGQVRITVEGKSAEIGYSIAPSQRGKGYGSQIVALLPDMVRKDFPEVETLIAQVKPENKASQKVFENNHFDFKNVVYELKI